jgi:hypothetical protein
MENGSPSDLPLSVYRLPIVQTEANETYSFGNGLNGFAHLWAQHKRKRIRNNFLVSAKNGGKI